MTDTSTAAGSRDPVPSPKEAEAALKRLGYAKIAPVARDLPVRPEFWVQESGVPRRTFPVFIEAPRTPELKLEAWARSARAAARRAIVIVPTDRAAEEAWRRVRHGAPASVDSELAILVLPRDAPAARPHWHAGQVSPKELLRLATGVVVGLFRRAQASEGSAQVDFEEMLEILKGRFRVDVHRSLGVASDEDALFLLYQLAVRDAYAPGDAASNLHVLVLKPTGPASRLPWFAA